MTTNEQTKVTRLGRGGTPYVRVPDDVDPQVAADTLDQLRLGGTMAAYQRHIKRLERKLADTEAMTAIIIRERDALRDEEPPDGFPSWEDWLANGPRITFDYFRFDYSHARSAWTFFIDGEGSGQFFPDYPSALAAAKKEAGHEVV